MAIVGLGAGTLACFARPGQSWTFYELDPAVLRIAQDLRFFSYLSDCRARGVALEIIPGDARLRLGEAADQRYQLIVLDVFSSDAIRSTCSPRGLPALSIEAGRRRAAGLPPVQSLCRSRPGHGQPGERRGHGLPDQYDLDRTDEEQRAGKQPSIWAVLVRREADLGNLTADRRWLLPRQRPGARPWTDDFSNLASYLVWRGRRFSAPAMAPRVAQGSSSLILRTRSVVLSPSRRGQIATLPP